MDSTPECFVRLLKLNEQVKSGKKKLTKAQQDKLDSLISAIKLSEEANNTLLKTKAGVLYEIIVYTSKLSVLEKIGVRNQWGHQLLEEMKTILYAEGNGFQLDDYAGKQ
ncbi:hypothetical protein TVAG_183190 [Trichomonas vaginalis G3]|uniref:Uncharacterized protein n=1 Tax=Trichomonas vaginalis (strain ATCC PRA-98 / G3) TaxID=412133 RepID=A2D957_TRIV3|nr:hypothetical protein TVAGG3_0529820 [Trichomonas vaginalis G3]EAY23083.1 hypothetical protein TVAG_183190 [Trichomonas vaginalis G3]KAI5519051.1 hypothetical protein TVAGG3_0529820 [Trichomonas vaginalis G3]|eukprot:XP_001584069.1 hypothetical protein [Trichomonas vaginalis G3]